MKVNTSLKLSPPRYVSVLVWQWLSICLYVCEQEYSKTWG